jgi:hypothetical protein
MVKIPLKVLKSSIFLLLALAPVHCFIIDVITKSCSHKSKLQESSLWNAPSETSSPVEDSSDESVDITRRRALVNFLQSTAGLATTTFIGSSAVIVPAVSDFVSRNPFPREQERRISKLFETAIVEASRSGGELLPGRALRILEVGIGSNCRSVLNGLYDDALLALSAESQPFDDSGDALVNDDSKVDTRIEMVGLDIHLPTTEKVAMAQDWFDLVSPSIPVGFRTINANIENQLNDFEDGYFGKSQ